MTATSMETVPIGARRRLVDHYGPAVDRWLDAVPGLLDAVAARWHLRIDRFHDAGCASIIAVVTTADGEELLLKAWYDRGRYARELGALGTWPTHLVPRVVHHADDLAIAAMTVVGGRLSGGDRPTDEYEMVASGLAELHAGNAEQEIFPALDDYLADVVLPRVGRRLRTLGSDLPAAWTGLFPRSSSGGRTTVLLHGDLYRENVLFDSGPWPVFIDPLPMRGDPAYDWAFWVVYYDLDRGQETRLEIASSVGAIPTLDLRPWCLVMGVDGLLYYRETGDSREPRMREIVAGLVAAW